MLREDWLACVYLSFSPYNDLSMKKFVEQLQQLQRLDALIRRKATGNPLTLASKFGVSERTIYNLLDMLKSLGAEIGYSREMESYYYEQNFVLQTALELKW